MRDKGSVIRVIPRVTEPGRVLAEALAVIDEGLVVQGLDQTLLACNKRAGEMLGVRSDEVLGRPAGTLPVRVRGRQGTSVGAAYALGARTLATGDAEQRVPLQLGRRDGSYVWVLANHRPLVEKSGSVWGVATSLLEITEQWETARQLADLATHDALTGLPSRYEFEEHLQPLLARAARAGTGVLVLFMGLDVFKRVNEELGHAAGDELLRGVSKRLRLVIRGSDLLCRYRGDEFAAIAPDLSLALAAKTADRLMKRIGLALAHPFEVAGTRRQISISVGSAVYPLDAPDATGLLLCAETEMCRHKLFGDTY